MNVLTNPVLVLNQDYQPINICQARRALVLLLWGKAEIVENGRGEIHSINYVLTIPSVIHLSRQVKRPYFERRITRFEIFSRDSYTCQYCGKKSKELTLDHIVPRYRGGEHSWENVVTCCISCNCHKAGLTPSEAGMQLLRKPLAPPPGTFYVPYQYLRVHYEWQKFVPPAVTFPTGVSTHYLG